MQTQIAPNTGTLANALRLRILAGGALFAWCALTPIPLRAAAARPWVRLTNCVCVAHSANDGDSFHVNAGTNRFVLRLYYVDAPELNLTYGERTREQSEYFGVTLDETLKAGRQARDITRELLQEPFAVWTRWATAAGRSTERRCYGLVEVGGRDLGEILLSRGLARVRGITATLPAGERSKTYLVKLRRLQAEAKDKKLGIWANSTPETQERPEPAKQAP